MKISLIFHAINTLKSMLFILNDPKKTNKMLATNQKNTLQKKHEYYQKKEKLLTSFQKCIMQKKT